MIIIAERINATRKRIGKAVAERDARLIRREARKQAEAGATHIDCNAGRNPDSEIEDLKWLIGCVQEEVEVPISIDSANPEAIAAGLKLVRKTPIINSVTAEKERIERVMPLAAESGAMLVALCLGDGGMPNGLNDRLNAAGVIVKAAEGAGVSVDRLIFDPLIVPISTDAAEVRAAIEAVREIMRRWPGAHTACGLSNISFGLPCRNVLNRTFLAMLIEAGLDGAIMDPTEPHMMSTVLAAEALAGRDEYCMNYIKAGRADQLD
jgi:5-methyltetrahydrofolate--homocysteine methyltransferase